MPCSSAQQVCGWAVLAALQQCSACTVKQGIIVCWGAARYEGHTNCSTTESSSRLVNTQHLASLSRLITQQTSSRQLQPPACQSIAVGNANTAYVMFYALQAEVPEQSKMRLAGVNGFMPYKSAAELIKHSMVGYVAMGHISISSSCQQTIIVWAIHAGVWRLSRYITRQLAVPGWCSC